MDTSALYQMMELKCTAFPEGIPKPILNNEIDHRERRPY